MKRLYYMATQLKRHMPDGSVKLLVLSAYALRDSPGEAALFLLNQAYALEPKWDVGEPLVASIPDHIIIKAYEELIAAPYGTQKEGES